MKRREEKQKAVDHWLRAGLEPDREATGRIAHAAMGGLLAERRSPMPGRWVPVSAIALASVVVVWLWSRDGGAPSAGLEPIRITNFGELVTVLDPGGAAWLHAPERPTAADAPRLIITLGGTDAE